MRKKDPPLVQKKRTKCNTGQTTWLTVTTCSLCGGPLRTLISEQEKED